MSIHLRRTRERVEEVEAATARLGHRVGLAGLLPHLDRQAELAAVPGRAVEWGWTWEPRDEENRRWWPQGITTSADAGPASAQGRRLVVVSWYAREVDGRRHGSRVTVVDLDTLSYRHVLLVEAVDGDGGGGGPRFRPLQVHAGGLAWWGPHLHVAATLRGLVTCRVDDLVRVDDLRSALGYRYVLPVRSAYRAEQDEGTEPMRYSFCSLDTGADPPQLVAGEYSRGDTPRRIAHFPLDPTTELLAAGPDGRATARGPEDVGLRQMQGAVTVAGTHYVTSSRGRFRHGTLYVGRPGGFRSFPGALPIGPEDIAYWPELDLLWSVTEHPGRRYVFAMRRGTVDMG